MSRIGRFGLGLGFALGLGCGGPDNANQPPPKPPQPAPVAAPAPGTPGANRPAPPPPLDPVKKALRDEVRKRPFRPEEFVESETNRDPFRSFLSDFSGKPSIATQYKILIDTFSLDELKLIAIVGPAHGGGAYVPARAMFVDPQGKGVSIVRGDHFSKADAKVTRIDSDKGKVFVELKEDLGGGKTRVAERVLELHQNEPVEGATP